MNMLALLLSIS